VAEAASFFRMHWKAFLDDPSLGGFAAREEGGTSVLVRRGYEGWTERLGLGSEAAEDAERVGGGRAPHPLVELPGGERVLVRRYLRGGAVRHLSRDRYLLGHRAFAELRALERARAAGVRAPEGIAAAERPRFPGYSAWLATRWIPEALDLHAWLVSNPAEEGEAALRAAGEQVGRLHAAGLAHPDLNLRNLLVASRGEDEADGVWVLDFDRARLFPGPVPARRRARDLLRLARSARKLGSPVGDRGWAALRAGYGGDWPLRSDLG
jgi:3-deoxy-D-manno-octulosonic acid kinase